VHEALSYAIATGIWMLNEPILSSPRWSSMPMVHMTRPMIMCKRYVMDTHRILAIFILKNMNMDMDEHHEHPWKKEKPQKYTASGLPAGPPR
jgi:hypothetical protein